MENISDAVVSMDESLESMQRILRISEKDATLTVDRVDCSAGSRKGDNYMSVVKRVYVVGKKNENRGLCFLLFSLMIII